MVFIILCPSVKQSYFRVFWCERKLNLVRVNATKNSLQQLQEQLYYAILTNLKKKTNLLKIFIYLFMNCDPNLAYVIDIFIYFFINSGLKLIQTQILTLKLTQTSP